MQQTSEFVAFGVLRIAGLDPVTLVDRQRGIGKWQTMNESGESYLIHEVLPKLIPANAVIFDVGANTGHYAAEVRQRFPVARILAFEPNPSTRRRLLEIADKLKLEVIPAAVGEADEQLVLFDYSNDSASEHASLYRDAMALHGAKSTAEIAVDCVTLDHFCQERSIEHIHFLKLDIEGHELAALRGARRLLASDAIDVIQFEFNEMNVFSRTFLHDFYSLLTDYSFFRLDSRRLIDLQEYSSSNEIFRFQNLAAIRKTLIGDGYEGRSWTRP